MAKPAKRDIVNALLDRYPKTFAEELGINVSRNAPSPLFRLLCMSLLMSARISGNIAMEAARALAKQKWNSAERMANSTWEQRAKVLNESGYARYDERTSAMLGDTTGLLLERYGGDLRRLRDEAGRDPTEERKLLKHLKGMGDSGVDIFFREAQIAWAEVAPFADRKALAAASKLGLGDDAKALARLEKGANFARLVAALVRVDLDKAHDEVVEAAR